MPSQQNCDSRVVFSLPPHPSHTVTPIIILTSLLILCLHHAIPIMVSIQTLTATIMSYPLTRNLNPRPVHCLLKFDVNPVDLEKSVPMLRRKGERREDVLLGVFKSVRCVVCLDIQRGPVLRSLQLAVRRTVESEEVMVSVLWFVFSFFSFITKNTVVISRVQVQETTNIEYELSEVDCIIEFRKKGEGKIEGGPRMAIQRNSYSLDTT
jgi:hypothetical protein